MARRNSSIWYNLFARDGRWAGSRALLRVGLAAVAVLPCGAQMHKVEAPQKVTRAVGVFEWTGQLPKPDSARLVPVSLFINGHFEDAGVYLAQPVPFALQTGVQYSVLRAGEPFGTLNLETARDVVTKRAASDDNPVGAWYGYGSFAVPKIAPPPKLKQSASLSSIAGSKSDDKPHFSGDRSARDSGDASPKAASGTPPAASAGSASTPKVDVDTGDDDRPHMTRRADSDSSASTAPANTRSSAPDDADDPDRPTLKHRDDTDETKNKKPKKEKPEGYVEPMAKGLNDDPDRPTMKRGKPEGAIATAQLTGNPPSMHQAVAVSDAASQPEHNFARAWESPDERASVMAAMEMLARPRVQNYLTKNQLTVDAAAAAAPAPADGSGPHLNTSKVASKTAAGKTAGSKAAKAAAPAAPVVTVPLVNEQLAGYELSYGGLPTFVYTAETPLADGGPVYVTLVAQRLPSGETQVSLATVTDANHLNRTPWMRLVDAVDADGSHRASLLFELRAQSSRQFALYRLVTAEAEQTFETGIIE